MESEYTTSPPSRAEIDAMTGAAVLEFGTGWCGHCRAAAPHVAQALQGHEDVKHLKVEDGSGRPLGRSFDVTLWPTLVFLRDGAEVARVVRPRSTDVVREALAKII
ncbi:MAG: thioredoxin family protein [Ramlibacter sp.]|nr:thioredoxin family protein [Ramlibacter sp.]